MSIYKKPINLLDKLNCDSSHNGASQLFCLGIDPQPEVIPSGEKYFIENTQKLIFNTLEMLAKNNIIPGAIKPNVVYYLALDRPRFGEFMGSRLLGRLLDLCEQLFPETPIILDYKTGDIDRSAKAMAESIFIGWRAFATTVHPYMGTDSIRPYLEYGNIYVLVRTSNPSARELQDYTNQNNEALYIESAKLIQKLNIEFPGRIGAVVGATYPDEIKNILAVWRDTDIPLLIPGIGAQGGDLQMIINILKSESRFPYIHRINNSSKLWGAWKNKEGTPEHHVVQAIRKFIDDILKFSS